MSSPSSPLRLDGRFLAIGLAGYARSTLASAVKILIGRKAHFTARDVLFRQYVGRLLGFETLRSVTSAHGSREGAGSNALMAMYAISFARTHGLAYVHTPFSEIYHADRPIAEWSAAWDKLFNLGAGAAASRSTPVNFALTCMDLWSLFGDAVPQPFSAEMVAE